MNSPFKGTNGPLLIAEIGGNHEGNFEYAKELVKLAIQTDVDIIKFQIYSGDALVSQMESPDRNKHFKKFELSKKQHLHLAEMVVNSGKQYTSSVWDLESLSWIDDYMSLYKIGSGDLTAYPLLKKIAKRGKPIVLSTGLSTEREVFDAISYIQNVNSIYKDRENLALLQCTSMYPISFSDVNLDVMRVYKRETGLTVGYSDHTEGNKALKYAASIGAEILEFHFTDIREGKTFRDHKVSLTPEEVTDLVAELNVIRDLMGSDLKQPANIEIEHGHDVSFRRAIYPNRFIQEGELLTEENVTVLRPNHGIDAREFDKVLGKKAAVDLQKHQKLEWDLLA